MKNTSLALEPILAPSDQVVPEQVLQEQWVQEEEKLRNERSRWEEKRAHERLQELLPALDLKRLVL